MTRDDLFKMAKEVGIDSVFKLEVNDFLLRFNQGSVERFADLVAAAEREKIAQSWDALHDKYMADPLRRQMMLSYEMVANLIRGKE